MNERLARCLIFGLLHGNPIGMDELIEEVKEVIPKEETRTAAWELIDKGWIRVTVDWKLDLHCSEEDALPFIKKGGIRKIS